MTDADRTEHADLFEEAGVHHMTDAERAEVDADHVALLQEWADGVTVHAVHGLNDADAERAEIAAQFYATMMEGC